MAGLVIKQVGKDSWLAQIATAKLGMADAVRNNGAGLAPGPVARGDTINLELKYRKLVDLASLSLQECFCDHMPDNKRCGYCCKWDEAMKENRDMEKEQATSKIAIPTPDQLISRQQQVNQKELDELLETALKYLFATDWTGAAAYVCLPVGDANARACRMVILALQDKGWDVEPLVSQKDGNSLTIRLKALEAPAR